MIVLVTGVAGFIGFHLAKRLIKENIIVVGIDNINDYYDQNLKKSRLKILELYAKNKNTNFYFYKVNLEDNEKIDSVFQDHKPTHVVNLAAQAGVRYSLQNPSAYIQSNLVGFSNILQACRKNSILHLIYASSSSVYGGNSLTPFSEDHGVNHPVSLYAATKRSNELMAHTYSHLYSMPTTGLRFFTVYGPWGRPDMSYFLFTKAIIEDQSIDVFNFGEMERDFTYIDDIIESIIRVIKKIPQPNNNFDYQDPDISMSWAPHKIFNIGNSSTVNLIYFIEIIEEVIGKKAKKNLLPMPKGDVKSTLADTSLLEEWIGFKPNTSLKEGYKNFYLWYKKFYNLH